MVFGIDDAILLGVGQAGMGIMQGVLGGQAAQQDYKNQKAMQSASAQYASWSSNRQVEIQDLNNQYQFWQQKVQHGQNLVYTNQLRNYELSKAYSQAENVALTRASSQANYAQSSQALSEQFAQQAAADSISMQQYMVQGLRARAQIAAGDQEGNSVDRRMNDYFRQVGDQQSIQTINAGFRAGQYNRQQAGTIAQYLNQYNSQQFYQMQEFQDPIPPYAPLPTLVMPAGPSMTGAAPSSGATALNIGSAVLGGVGTYMSSSANLAKYRGGGGGGGGVPQSTATATAFAGINLLD
jgi:hypothetical protein